MPAPVAIRLVSGAATLVALYLGTHAIGAFMGWKVMDVEPPEAAAAEDDEAEAEADDEEDESKRKPKIPTVKTQPDARLTRITRYNAFCPTCVPEDAPPEEAAQPALPVTPTGELEFPGAVRSQLPLALVATMEAEAPGISLATISKQDGGTGVYAEGDEVLDQVTLLAVDLGIVYLRTATRVEYLQVSSDDPPPVPTAMPTPKDEGKDPPKTNKNEIDGASDAISCQGMSCTVKREFVSQLLANPAVLAGQGNARPYSRDDLKGFRLSRVKSGSVPNMLGLRSGDVITGINGQPLDSLDGAMKLYARLRNASHLTVDLTRNRSGERQELRLDISII
ncbi:type II secretion system protein GspC [Paraliomyxa miuraensis]|uniref:type II secretion system protein GspC n=1 Tax=Paraliomyxa miuraensis TaxID=376150 RepID=UPI002252F327|nr:type II secretion system protein GspC [Paraliomyxa miuraensis]MCX4245966.1 hypothetical protein [Paraliomyxa miuraensis]